MLRQASWRCHEVMSMEDGTATINCYTSYGSIIGADGFLCLAKKCFCFLHCGHVGAMLFNATCVMLHVLPTEVCKF